VPTVSEGSTAGRCRRLEGRVALISGAASGIGRATALRFAAEGAALMAVDVQDDALDSLAGELREAGVPVATAHCDVTDEDQVRAAVQQCLERFGALHQLTNMAGILRFDHSHTLSLADFNRVQAVNVTGTFLFCREALPALLEQQGNIVNASSTAALQGIPWCAAYAASKGAVLAMTRAIAVEYADRGLRANCVCPADIRTPMTRPTFPEGADLRKLGRLRALTGMRGPEVVAAVIAMLASDDAVHITGEAVRVDGGALS
jgi:NAD(P)-dependent dehydrogenase (short-subunit alcohol dehydrogenase family)